MRAGALWPLAVVAVLGVTVAANAVLFYQASDRHAAVVEPDYYRKAVEWDSTLAQERRNRELGWRIEADPGPLAGPGSMLRVRLSDREGGRLSGASIQVTAIHNLAADRPIVAGLEEGSRGAYEALLPLPHAGLWELRFDVSRGDDRFTASIRRDVARSPRP